MLVVLHASMSVNDPETVGNITFCNRLRSTAMVILTGATFRRSLYGLSSLAQGRQTGFCAFTPIPTCRFARPPDSLLDRNVTQIINVSGAKLDGVSTKCHVVWDFLARSSFGDAFTSKNVVRSFNVGIRNGILHDAETRKWVIWRDEPTGLIVDEEDDGYALNRELFYAALQQEFKSYISMLNNPRNQELRESFKAKMDDICRGT